MTILIATVATAVVACLAWLVMTRRVTFPLLFDVGLASIALGVIVLADGAVRDTLSRGGAFMFCIGTILLLFSYVKQTRKYERKHKYGEPRELDGRHMHNIPGGKK